MQTHWQPGGGSILRPRFHRHQEMPPTSKKSRKHHHVPQFYLRYFSFEKDKKRIRLYNLSNKIAATNGIGAECQEKGFYLDWWEDTLADIERSVGSLIPRIHKDRTVIDEVGTKPVLSPFAYLQSSRSVVAADLTKALAERDGVQMGETPASIPALVHFARTFGVVMDLKPHLIINKTSRELITSDNPVICHDQYNGPPAFPMGGWGNRGFQAFYPLSPCLLLHLYDSKVYEMKGASPDGSWTEVKREYDISQLNILQILNAKHSVYYLGETERQRGLVEAQCKRFADKKRPPATVAEIEKAAAAGQEVGYGGKVRGTYTYKGFKLDLKFVGVRKPYAKVKKRDRKHQYRTVDILREILPPHMSGFGAWRSPTGNKD